MPPACPPLSSFAAEVTAHLNKQHSLSMMVGIGTFDQPVIRWHFERGSADELATLDGKLAADRDYSALVEKYKDTWFTQHSSFRKVDGRQSVTMPKGTEFMREESFSYIKRIPT